MSPKLHTASQCQHTSARGHRCHMLIDNNHGPTDGANRPTLCAYHASKIKTGPPAPDPQVVAAELLEGVDQFCTADEVNFFLGNLIKQLAYKRIARRDAIALAYISQLLLRTLRAMQQEAEAKKYEEGNRSLLEGFSVPVRRRWRSSHRPLCHPRQHATQHHRARQCVMTSRNSSRVPCRLAVKPKDENGARAMVVASRRGSHH